MTFRDVRESVAWAALANPPLCLEEGAMGEMSWNAIGEALVYETIGYPDSYT